MSTTIDFEDKSVDKAIEKACAQLNVSKQQLQYDIISYGSSGIFGLVGAKKALIRVSVPEETGAVADTGQSGEAQDFAAPHQEVSDVSALVDEAFGSNEAEADSADVDAADIDEMAEDTAGVSALEDERDVTEEALAEAEADAEAEAEADADAEDEDEGDAEPEPEPVDAQKQQAVVDWVKGFLEQIIALVSPDARISVETVEGALRFQVKEGDAARLIGKRGQTLDAVQYLADKAVHKQFGNGVQVEIDVEGYLDKRRSDLTDLATRLADKAQQTGKPMVINRINAQDRRVVHLALKENRNVRTQSVGNGDFRKLLILPKKKAGAKKQKNKQ